MKKIFFILACSLLIITGCNNETSNNKTNNSETKAIVYYDNSRNLKDTYTFKEAVSKFAFKVNETTLIFGENDNGGNK